MGEREEREKDKGVKETEREIEGGEKEGEREAERANTENTVGIGAEKDEGREGEYDCSTFYRSPVFFLQIFWSIFDKDVFSLPALFSYCRIYYGIF